MKKYIILIVILIIIGVVLFIFLRKKEVVNVKISDDEIRESKSIHLEFSVSGMMVPYTYVFDYDGESAKLDKVNYNDEVEKSVVLNDEDVDFIKESLIIGKVSTWDEFSGNNPYVLDGEMFSFYLKINDIDISAGGSNSFPEGYQDFKNKMHEIIKKYDIIE